jgi:hypothetical protein
MKDWLIKSLIVFAVGAGLYYWMSPYQNCLRSDFIKAKSSDFQKVRVCSKQTDW